MDRLRPLLLALVAACGGASPRPAPATTPASTAPAQASAQPVAAAPAPAVAAVASHGVALSVPDGWSTSAGDGWALARAPGGVAGYFLYGVDDPSGEGPDMLHRAEKELALRLPVGLGKVTTFASGIRLAVLAEETTGADGAAVTALTLVGGCPLHHPRGAIGVFAFWRKDADPAVVRTLTTTIDGIAVTRP
jgi:hypothetical protein